VEHRQIQLVVVKPVGALEFWIGKWLGRMVVNAVLLALAGSSVGVLYPLAVGLLPEALSSAELPRGNAMTTFCYGLGSIVGPFVPSLIMHVTIPQSLFAVAAALYIAVLLWMLRQPKHAVSA